jgi:peptidoglycan/xylan/chitin deacetylase (PgdA/CDA1 family)
MTERPSFALCLTHDVDRPYKTYQGLFYGLTEPSGYHLRTVLSDDQPYWQFEEILRLEAALGVRSAFYFLSEPSLLDRSPGAWLSPANWVEHAGRYDLTDEPIASVVRRLDEDGWEVGLHGSRDATTDARRLAAEKDRLESVLGHTVTGGRHHHLALDAPATWRRHASLGLSYDSSLGSRTGYGFEHGYEPLRPFDDEFVVFPLTLMEMALPDPDREYEAAWSVCEDLLEEAAANEAVMTVLWHPRYFNEREFPGYGPLYRQLVERALEMGGWVGPPRDLYDRLPLPDASTEPSGDRRWPRPGAE